MKYENNIAVGGFQTGHVQGIAIDSKREFMYYSFTTCLVKTDLKGNVIGTVKDLAGHLGCIAYCEEEGRVYGSLEYKHDAIGASIFENAGREVEDGFYIAIFDVEKIDRMDMNAEKDKIMTSVFLKEVLDDYKAPGHRYGCSGIDGTTFAPMPGCKDGKMYLYVAYGIYSDVERRDNDYQVILRYDTSDWKKYEAPLDQSAIHNQGPVAPDSKYFVYTGNTTYGVQNLEYDPYTGYMFAAVYRGDKECFTNYRMFVINMNEKASVQPLKGIEHEGEVLSLAEIGEYDETTGIYGCWFPYGNTGMISLEDSYFYFSEPKRYDSNTEYGTVVRVYQYTPDDKILFKKVN